MFAGLLGRVLAIFGGQWLVLVLVAAGGLIVSGFLVSYTLRGSTIETLTAELGVERARNEDLTTRLSACGRKLDATESLQQRVADAATRASRSEEALRQQIERLRREAGRKVDATDACPVDPAIRSILKQLRDLPGVKPADPRAPANAG